MDPDTASALLATGVSADMAIVGTLPRSPFSPEATLMMIRALPEPTRASAASEVMTALIQKIESTKNALVRSRAMATVGMLAVSFCAAPAIVPRRILLRQSEYYALACCWGRSVPCLCRVVAPSPNPETREYARFRQWHLFNFCRNPGERIIVDWESVSDVLIRRFCTSMASVAVREAGRPLFPPELVDLIARYIAEAETGAGSTRA